MALSAPAVPSKEQAARALGRRIRASGLPELLASYHGASEELPELSRLKRDLRYLPSPLETLVKFFVLGEAVLAAEVRRGLGEEALLAFSGSGLLVDEDGRISMPDTRLVHHLGALVFVERPKIPVTFYYGNDSLALGKLLPPARGRVLDLCAGVGTQGLACAFTADRVVSVERVPSVAELYHLNALVNGVEEKMELRIGDFVEAVEGETFDRVCCNPPLLPVPEELSYPLVGDGGADGLRFVDRLLESLPRILREDGTCHVVGTVLGDASGPALDLFETRAREGGLDLLLLLPLRMEMKEGSRMLESLSATAARFGRIQAPRARAAYLESLAPLGRTHLYTFLMVGRRGRGSVAVTRHYERGRSLWAV